jgi:hypothetical protein
VSVGLRGDAVVMASHAIFPRDGGMEAPASVVGLQFQHSALLSRFISITSKTTVSKSVYAIQCFDLYWVMMKAQEGRM